MTIRLITSFVLQGGYVERIYFIGKPIISYENLRDVGDWHVVTTNTIHQIISLPQGECWTLILPGPKVKESGFYKFEQDKVYFRHWFENEFKLLDV